jgi:hypothetical protein
MPVGRFPQQHQPEAARKAILEACRSRSAPHAARQIGNAQFTLRFPKAFRDQSKRLFTWVEHGWLPGSVDETPDRVPQIDPGRQFRLEISRERYG